MALETPAGVKNPNSSKFSWDEDIPDTPFWGGIKYTTARNFIQCFTPAELVAKEPSFGSLGTAPKAEKVAFLLSETDTALAAKERAAAPSSLPEADYDAWQCLVLSRISCFEETGDRAAQAGAIQMMIDRPREPGGTNYSGVNMMANLKEESGDYAEAERLFRTMILPHFRAHEMLGPDSPPTLGSMRCLLRCLWKQGKHEEAQVLEKEMSGLIETMDSRQSRFVKYQDDERGYLRAQMEELKRWTLDQGMTRDGRI